MSKFETGKDDSNKNATDINVGSIEEDIKVINKIILFYKDLDAIYDKNKCDEIKALEHILSDYTRQKQKNEQYQKINVELREKVKELEEENRMFKNNKVLVSRYFKLKDNSISKQKIKDKIEELRNEKEQLRIEKGVLWDSGIYKIDLKIEILQELLQESEDK